MLGAGYACGVDAGMRRQLEELVSGRRDPRRGVGPGLGRVRWALTWLFFGALVFGGCFGGLVPRSVGGLPLAVVTANAYFLFGAGLAVCWLLPISVRARTRRRYQRHAGFLCPWCRYPLSGLPERGRCPECGSGFRADACRTLYDCAYRPFRPDPVTLKQRERTAWEQALMERSAGGGPATRPGQWRAGRSRAAVLVRIGRPVHVVRKASGRLPEQPGQTDACEDVRDDETGRDGHTRLHIH